MAGTWPENGFSGAAPNEGLTAVSEFVYMRGTFFLPSENRKSELSKFAIRLLRTPRYVERWRASVPHVEEGAGLAG